MRLQFESIPKEDREAFKKALLDKEKRLNIYFTLNKAIVEVTEPYTITDEWLSIKSNIKKAIHSAVAEFRIHQFNSPA